MSQQLILDLTFRYTLDPLQGILLTQKSPLTGKITEVTMHFPDGCDSLVDVAFGVVKGGKYVGLIPYEALERNTFIALNDATKPFRMNYPVKLNQRLWAMLRNGDGGNPHTPSVIVEVEGEAL